MKKVSYIFNIIVISFLIVSCSGNKSDFDIVFHNVDDITVDVGSDFDVLDNVSAIGSDLKNYTDSIDYSSDCLFLNGSSRLDTREENACFVTYSINFNSIFKTHTRLISITVPPDTTAPMIFGALDLSISVGDSLNPTQGVTAIDDIDGDLTQDIIVSLPAGMTLTDDILVFNSTGEYTIRYEVTDSAGNNRRVSRRITVTGDVIPE